MSVRKRRVRVFKPVTVTGTSDVYRRHGAGAGELPARVLGVWHLLDGAGSDVGTTAVLRSAHRRLPDWLGHGADRPPLPDPRPHGQTDGARRAHGHKVPTPRHTDFQFTISSDSDEKLRLVRRYTASVCSSLVLYIITWVVFHVTRSEIGTDRVGPGDIFKFRVS